MQFYVTKDSQTAENGFTSAKATFEAAKGTASSYSSFSGKNYASYSLSSNGRYMYTCHVDNTLVFASASDENKEAVKALIDAIGY